MMDTDKLRYIARVSTLNKDSCQVCEDAAEEIDSLRSHLVEIEEQVRVLADLFEQEWRRTGKTDKVSKSIAERLYAVVNVNEGGNDVPDDGGGEE